MESLKTQQDQIKRHLISKITNDISMIKNLADDMAESATNIQGQGYLMFVQSREKFLSELDRVTEEYCALISPEKPSKVS